VQVRDSTPERLLVSDTTCQRSDHEAFVCPGESVLF
jgi:phosphoserine phosphatase RsbU/P